MAVKSLTGYKPSFYLQAMVDGLLAAEKRKDFNIEMDTFGSYDPDAKTCFGCAATCALMQLTKTQFTDGLILTSHLRAFTTHQSYGTILEFETAMDLARSGSLHKLFRFAGMLPLHRKRYDQRFYLSSAHWREELPKVERLIEELKQAGC